MCRKIATIMLFFVVLAIFSPLAFSASKKPTMSYPVSNFTMTSPYGWRIHPITGIKKFHSGVDLAGNYGDPVRAALDGTVSEAGWISGYGYTVIIDHGNGYMTLYGHNQKLRVSAGQRVKRGQRIADMGSTGNSTGPHCHFEVRINGQVDEPGKYIPGLLAMELAGGGSYSGSTDLNDKPKKLELAEDFAKPLRDFTEQIGKIFEKAISLIKDLVWQIFIVLAVIDFALSAMYKAIGEEDDGQSFISWFLYKIVFLGFLLYFLTNWGDIIGGIALNGFPALGSMAINSNLSEAGKILSDPTSIVQKGLSIIVPIINEAMKLDADFSIVDFVLSAINPVDHVIESVCLICGCTLFFFFFLIGIELIMAYVYFYTTILFSFTGFMFASFKHTRKWASNGLNGVFASSLTLMFFCLFSVMLQFSMEKLTMGDIISFEKNTEEIKATDKLKSLDDVKARIKIVESSGGNYTVYNYEGSGAYGAYQFMPEFWDDRCRNYIDAGGTLCTADSCPNNPSNAPKTKYAWCPENQDKMADYQLLCYYDKYKDYNKVAMCWWGEGSIGTKEGEEYLQLILNAKGRSEYESRILAVELLVQLTMLVLVFMMMADRISKMINKYFGGMGFKLTNEG